MPALTSSEMQSPDAEFTLRDPNYYEPPDHGPLDETYLRLLLPAVPITWRVSLSGRWILAEPLSAQRPDQGFKIHVSCSVTRGREVLAKVLPSIVSAKSRFRVIREPFLHELQNSRLASRADCGKFITIDTSSTDEFKLAIAQLDSLLGAASYGGPRVLSDRVFRDSESLSYRYGSFGTVCAVAVDGTTQRLLGVGDGRTIVDEICVGGAVPPGIIDPFAPESPRGQPASPIILGDRYQVISVLHPGPCGSVYVANDLVRGHQVVIKEARPCTSRLTLHGARDSTELLEHEWRILSFLAGAEGVPRVIDFLYERGHAFLVQEYLGRKMLRPYLAHWQRLIAPNAGKRALLLGAIANYRNLSLQLVDLVEGIHARGVVIGDMNIYNVIVCGTAPTVSLVDFKAASIVSEARASMSLATELGAIQWRTKDRLLSPTFNSDDDWFGVGMTLFSMMLPGTDRAVWKPAALQATTDWLVELGIPAPAIRAAYEAVAGGPNAAARVRDELRMLSGGTG